MTKKLWSDIKIECKRCNQLFSYTINLLDQRGSRSRKYCDECNILQHQDESRDYQRIAAKRTREDIEDMKIIYKGLQ